MQALSSELYFRGSVGRYKTWILICQLLPLYLVPTRVNFAWLKLTSLFRDFNHFRVVYNSTIINSFLTNFGCSISKSGSPEIAISSKQSCFSCNVITRKGVCWYTWHSPRINTNWYNYHYSQDFYSIKISLYSRTGRSVFVNQGKTRAYPSPSYIVHHIVLSGQINFPRGPS